MSDDKTKPGGADRMRIPLGEDYDVRAWARKFGVTPQELQAAVETVGLDAEAVAAYLRRSGSH